MKTNSIQKNMAFRKKNRKAGKGEKRMEEKRKRKKVQIIRCKEGNKEFFKEKTIRGSEGRLKLIAEFPVADPFPGEPSEFPKVWQMARHTARYYMRSSIAPSALVKESDHCIRVFRQY